MVYYGKPFPAPKRKGNCLEILPWPQRTFAEVILRYQEGIQPAFRGQESQKEQNACAGERFRSGARRNGVGAVKKLKKSKILSMLVTTLLVALYVFVNSQNLNPLYGDGAIFWAVVLTLYVVEWCFLTLGEIFISTAEEGVAFPRLKLPKAALAIIAVPWIYVAVMTVISLPIVSFERYRSQLGDPVVKTFSSDMQAVDVSQLPIVDKNLAAKLADKKLGERPSLGSQVMLGEPTVQMVDGELVWVVPLHHSGFFKWLTNMSGTPGYVVVSATNVNDVEYVEDYKIKYQPGCYLLDDLLRHARFNGGLFQGLTDYSFELDDSGRPYWVITTCKNTAGFALPEATGVLLVDAETGETVSYTIDQLPQWVDRVQPEDFILNQINNKGEYVHGVFNFANKDKYEASDGEIIVYNGGRCYLFTGLTSVGSDESAIGFMMIDMVTKEPFLYQMAGATEYAAQQSAEGKVQHLGYKAAFPLIINVSGQPTYFMPLKDKEGLIKQYAMVSVTNYSIVGTGETISAALSDYRRGLSGDSSIDLSGGMEETQFTGTISRIASEVNGSETVYKLILEQKPGVIFTVQASVSDQLALTMPGDRVTVEYLDTGETSLRCSSFRNTTIG